MRVTYGRIRRLLGNTGRLFAFGVVIATAQTALLAPIVLLVRGLFDTWIPQRDTEAIVLASLAMLGLFLASALVGYTSRRLAVRMVKVAVGQMRRDLLAQLYALPRSWHDRQDSGRLQALIVSDSERVDVILSQLAGKVVPASLVAIALCAVAAVLNPLLFGLLALSVPAFVLAAKHLGGRSRRFVKAYRDSLTEFGAETQTALRTVTLAKVAGAESWELERRGR